MFYSIYDNGATAVMGGFASTEPVEGVNMLDTLCGTVNSIVSGDKTVAEWQTAVEEASDKLRAAMNQVHSGFRGAPEGFCLWGVLFYKKWRGAYEKG